MKVTIITACYNRERTIRGCIESVLAQDYPDWWTGLLRMARSL